MGLYLSTSALSSFSPATQAELRDFINSQFTIGDNAGSAPDEGDGEEPADLSVAQAREVLKRVSDKVRGALRVIADSDPSGFTNTKVASALGVDLDKTDLRGVWGGITKRTRTVLGENSEAVIWWVWDDAKEDWIGRVSPTTHRSLRKVFNLPGE